MALVACLLLATPIFGQNQTGVSIRFLNGLSTESLTDAQLRTPEWESELFRIPYRELSLPQTAKSRMLRIFHQGGNPQPAPLCDVILPEQGSDFIVILVPGKDGPKAAILNSKAPGFRPGDIYMHNASEHTIALALGTTREVLKPAQGKAIRPGTPADASNYEVAVLYDDKGTAKPLVLTKWPLNDRLRGYVFFIPGKHNRPLYRAVQEFVPQSQPEP